MPKAPVCRYSVPLALAGALAPDAFAAVRFATLMARPGVFCAELAGATGAAALAAREFDLLCRRYGWLADARYLYTGSTTACAQAVPQGSSSITGTGTGTTTSGFELVSSQGGRISANGEETVGSRRRGHWLPPR